MPIDTRISVIIPSHNEEAHIERSIRSVADADEVIVADGESVDATAKIAEEQGCKVIRTAKGRGVQLRAGAGQATCDVLLFLHADSWLHSNAIGQLREHISRSRSARCYGGFLQSIDDPRFRFRCLEKGNAVRARWFRLPYGDQAIWVDRQTYDEVDGFAPVPLMEDVIFARRAGRLCRPTLLSGPVHLSARRWQENGVIHQTIRNWLILGTFACGVAPSRLAKWYS